MVLYRHVLWRMLSKPIKLYCYIFFCTLLNISIGITLYRIVSSYIVLHCILALNHVELYCFSSHHTSTDHIVCWTIWCNIVCIISCYTVSYHTRLYKSLSYHIMLKSYCSILYFIKSYQMLSHIIPNDVMSNHIVPFGNIL